RWRVYSGWKPSIIFPRHSGHSCRSVGMRLTPSAPVSLVALELHAHLAQHAGQRREEGVHVGREEVADVAEAEAVGLRELARIDEEAARGEAPVEVLEVEARVAWVEVRADDRARVLARDVGAEAERLHAVAQALVVHAVARTARNHAALELELEQRAP